MSECLRTDWASYKNIVCFRPDNLGDVLMTSPAIKAMKESVPGRKITLVASTSGSSIAKLITAVDDIITFDPPWQGNHISSPQHVSGFIETVRSRQFDAAVIFNVFSQNPLPAAMVCYQAGIPRVAGFCRENPYGLITDWIADKEPLYEIKHEVTRQLELVRFLGAEVHSEDLVLNINNTDVSKIQNKLMGFGLVPDKPWLILHPGVSESRRQYPSELFAIAAKKIVEQLNYQVLLTGTESEADLTNEIKARAGNGVYTSAGKLNLEELISVIDLSDLLISNNTGPVHIAAAVKTPVVVVYALTNPQHAPWRVRHCILPFSVPEDNRSKNSIINYAFEKFSGDMSRTIHPDKVVEAAKMILDGQSVSFQTELVTW